MQSYGQVQAVHLAIWPWPCGLRGCKAVCGCPSFACISTAVAVCGTYLGPAQIHQDTSSCRDPLLQKLSTRAPSVCQAAALSTCSAAGEAPLPRRAAAAGAAGDAAAAAGRPGPAAWRRRQAPAALRPAHPRPPTRGSQAQARHPVWQPARARRECQGLGQQPRCQPGGCGRRAPEGCARRCSHKPQLEAIRGSRVQQRHACARVESAPRQ